MWAISVGKLPTPQEPTSPDRHKGHNSIQPLPRACLPGGYLENENRTDIGSTGPGGVGAYIYVLRIELACMSADVDNSCKEITIESVG